MKKIIFTIALLTCFSLPITSFAENETPTAGETTTVKSGSTCNPAKGEVCIDNPMKGVDTPQKFIGNIIKALLGVIGSIALIMFVYGGFMWMTAAGDKNKVTKGMDTMLWAVLGLTVIFSSYALVRFVIEKVGS